MEVVVISSPLKLRKRKGLRFFAVLLSLFILFSLVVFTRGARKMLEAADSECGHLASRLLYDAALALPSELYSDITVVSRDSSGRITGISSNSDKINRLQSLYIKNVLSALSDNKKATISIPLGNLTGSIFLSGRGPSIKLIMIPTGSVEADIKSEFSAAGINQTKHTLYINAKISVRALFPFSSKTTSEVKIPVSETVIVGDIPTFYAEGR